MSGRLIISLDFELLWGVRDHADRDSYGANILGAREAIPQILDIFATHGMAATWATVGFLFCEDKDELMASLPDDLPAYTNSKLSNYGYLDDVGQDEKRDPYYFAPSLIDRIAKTPCQEIGTHTLSHYYCLEDGPSIASFEADLIAAKALAVRRGIELKSMVFPRNQYAAEQLDVCGRHGITAYRGNETAWAYRATPGSGQTLVRRGLRLIDAYTGLLGPHHVVRSKSQISNVPASRFLRPCAGRLARFQGRHLSVIKREMRAAAKVSADYHLWWHPHNFGRNTDENIRGLETIAAAYRDLREEFDMASATMSSK